MQWKFFSFDMETKKNLNQYSFSTFSNRKQANLVFWKCNDYYFLNLKNSLEKERKISLPICSFVWKKIICVISLGFDLKLKFGLLLFYKVLILPTIILRLIIDFNKYYIIFTSFSPCEWFLLPRGPDNLATDILPRIDPSSDRSRIGSTSFSRGLSWSSRPPRGWWTSGGRGISAPSRPTHFSTCSNRQFNLITSLSM